MHIMEMCVHRLTHDLHINKPLRLLGLRKGGERMDTLKRLDQLYIKGWISEEEYLEQKAKYADKIIDYLAAELAEAYEMHDQAKGKDAQEALVQLIRATTILHILEEIQ